MEAGVTRQASRTGGRDDAQSRGESPVRSISRAVAVLEQFSLERPELTFTEIATGVGLTKSTTHRLLAALQSEEMIEVDPRTSRYRLGLKVFRLGSIVAKTMEIATRAEPILAELADETDETAFVVVPDGDQALCIGRFDGSSHVRVLFLEIGKRQAFNCGAAPRVLLAYMPPQRWEEIVARHARAMTEHSLTSREDLWQDALDIRRYGCAVSREDVTLHACALGAPVRDASGDVVAAVSLSGIEQRFAPERLPQLMERVVAAGAELSRRLGYRPGPGGVPEPSEQQGADEGSAPSGREADGDAR
jgi:IclR family KDG regulon transcriptional repressor